MAEAIHSRTSPRERIWAHLELMRPANMVTSAADALAGFAVSGMAPNGQLFSLAGASLSLYGGGVVCNDLCDRRLDAVERPERPLPSGRAGLVSATLLGLALLAAGVALALSVSIASGLLAGAIATLALFYDFRAKHHALLGPLVLGLCRGMNFLLGLSAAGPSFADRWFLAALWLVYVASITVISAGEVHGGSRRAGLSAIILLGSALCGWTIVATISAPHSAAAGLLLAVLLFRVGPPFWRAYRAPQAAPIRSAVRAGVLSLVILDSSVAAGYAGLAYGLAVLALSLVASQLARVFAVT